MKRTKEMLKKIMMMMTLSFMMCSAYCMPVFAGGLMEKAANTLFGELWWLVLIVAGISALISYSKRNYSRMIISIVVGGLLAVIIKAPTLISKLGEYFGNKVFEGL